jgi:hypothetical protein
MAQVTFDSEQHVYSLGSQALPHVTGVLKATGVIDTRWYQQLHADRGSAVHTATVLLDDNRLDQASVDPRIRGYLDAYLLFMAVTEADWQHTEHIVYSQLYRYAGRLDRAGVVGWGGTLSNRPWVVDIKTGQPQRWARLQLAGYAQALREETGKVYQRATLWLRVDGSYRLEPYDRQPHTYREDLNAFLGGLALLRWMGREGEAT